MSKISSISVLFTTLLMGMAMSQDLKTTYEYFTEGGILTGLTADEPGFFKLNGKDVRLISGAMHYYRVHPSLWRDRLRKFRAAGLNTVETYVPWNLHEPQRGVFDFGQGGNDFSMFLDISSFIQMAQEEDLLVIVRPGPYICTEWDFGGLPSWLQRDPEMKVRTRYQPYLDRVKIYLDNLLPQIRELKFTQGGPVIAYQLENEYGSFDEKHSEYLELIEQVYNSHGLQPCLYFTSDGVYNGLSGTLPHLLYTANFQSNPKENLDSLLELQPDRPAMVMEYWSGWFDHWFEQHHTTNPATFAETLETIFADYNGSVNFYMFHGGTNFGFMAGANTMGEAPFYAADVTSYDYDAPLSEAGDYHVKYDLIVDLVNQYEHPALLRPERPAESLKAKYDDVTLQFYLDFEGIVGNIPVGSKWSSDVPVSMENLPMNGDSGQSYGYILYRKVLTTGQFRNESIYKAGPVKDFGQVLVNGELMDRWNYAINTEIERTLISSSPVGSEVNVDLLVENMARVNFGYAKDFIQQKGLPYEAGVTIDDVQVQDFEIYAMEFKSAWINGIRNWNPIENVDDLKGPCLIQSTFVIQDEPNDTWLDMKDWGKGVVFINGFNLGRYWRVGPQQNLYIPAPLLNRGGNVITIFEQIEGGNVIKFSDSADVGPSVEYAESQHSSNSILLNN